MSIKPGEGNYWEDRGNEVLISKFFFFWLPNVHTIIQVYDTYDTTQIQEWYICGGPCNQIIKPFAKARERPKQAPIAPEAQKTLKRRMRNITDPFDPNRMVSRRCHVMGPSLQVLDDQDVFFSPTSWWCFMVMSLFIIPSLSGLNKKDK